MERNGLNITDSVRRRMHNSLRYAVQKAERRGIKDIPTELHPEVRLVHAGGHATGPAFGGEPHERQAVRRRQVVRARLGPRALALDDAAQALTFATRAVARRALGRDAAREEAQLRALARALLRAPKPGA